MKAVSMREQGGKSGYDGNKVLMDGLMEEREEVDGQQTAPKVKQYTIITAIATNQPRPSSRFKESLDIERKSVGWRQASRGRDEEVLKQGAQHVGKGEEEIWTYNP
jgi:hypothetical protein